MDIHDSGKNMLLWENTETVIKSNNLIFFLEEGKEETVPQNKKIKNKK